MLHRPQMLMQFSLLYINSGVDVFQSLAEMKKGRRDENWQLGRALGLIALVICSVRADAIWPLIYIYRIPKHDNCKAIENTEIE